MADVPMRRVARGSGEHALPRVIEQVALSAEFDRALEEIVARWPGAPVEDEAFAAYVRAHLDGERDLLGRLPRLRITELFLVWWALESPTGLAAFLATYGQDLANTIACVTTRFANLDARRLLDELMIELFGDEPRALEYSGFGPLRAWLDVVAMQSLLDAAHGHATPA